MGADLLLTSMAAPHLEGSPTARIGDELAARVGHQRIDQFDLAAWADLDLEELALNLGIREWQDPDDPQPEQYPAAARDQLVQDVRAALHAALEAVVGYRRDVAEMQFGGRYYWITGGMSWGDTPTEAYEAIAALNWIGLFEDPIPTTE
ncbi:MAG: hypothetical protein J0G30_00135 [Actinomycetales bacterium]|nr:hypothetical protein [Actinomycetales bacterium]